MAGSYYSYSSSKMDYSAHQIPLGIQQLIHVDRVLVRQKTTVFKGNRYAVTAPDGELILIAKEDNGALGVMLGGKDRAFHMNIFDSQDEQVITLRRPYTFGVDKLVVKVCGVPASVVRRQSTLFKPVLHINNASDQPVLRVKGPASTTGETDFEILTMDKQQIGVIRRKWGGVLSELFTDTDKFDIRFPRDLDVRFKAAVLGACFLIDFMFYES